MQYKFIPAKIGAAMVNAGKDIYDIAVEADMTAAGVSAAIHGKTSPKAATVKKICDALGVIPSTVVEIIEEGTPRRKRKQEAEKLKDWHEKHGLQCAEIRTEKE